MKSAGPLVTRREPVKKQPSVTMFRLHLTPRDQQVQIADNIPTCTQSFKQRLEVRWCLCCFHSTEAPTLFQPRRKHSPFD